MHFTAIWVKQWILCKNVFALKFVTEKCFSETLETLFKMFGMPLNWWKLKNDEMHDDQYKAHLHSS